MDYKLNLILKDYFEKTSELENLNKNVGDLDYTSNISKELKEYNDKISNELYNIEFTISEINKKIINLEYNKQLELSDLSNKTNDILNNMIDNDRKKLIESRYDNQINILRDELLQSEKQYNDLKNKFEIEFNTKRDELKNRYDNIKNNKYETEDIKKCKQELISIIKSKQESLNEELENYNIQKSALSNLCERMISSANTLDDTCIDFLESQISDLKLCYENADDLIQKNEYDKNISDLKVIIDKIRLNEEINDYDKKVVVGQINFVNEYVKKIEKYIETFKVVDFIKLNNTNKNEYSEEKKENYDLNDADFDSISKVEMFQSKNDTYDYEDYEFESGADSLEFILNDILKELDESDLIYLDTGNNISSSVRVDDKKEIIDLGGVSLPSGEYVSIKELDAAIDKYYEKNKGKTYYIKERKFILNRNKSYQITKGSIDKLKESLKNRSAIKLINDNKIIDSKIRKIYGREALKENDNSEDTFEFETPEERLIGTIETNKEGKYISKMQLGFYLSKIFEKKGPFWVEKLKEKFSHEGKNLKEYVKK